MNKKQIHERASTVHRGRQPRGDGDWRPGEEHGVNADFNKENHQNAAIGQEVDELRWGSPLVDEDWHAVWQAIRNDVD